MKASVNVSGVKRVKLTYSLEDQFGQILMEYLEEVQKIVYS